MKAKILFVVLVALLFAVIGIFAYTASAEVEHAQPSQSGIYISPGSGPPGTVVNLYAYETWKKWDDCYANSTWIGTIPAYGTLAYTIPLGVNTVDFYCTLIYSSQVWETSPTVTFFVIFPDSDEDGVPDDQDQCPREYAPNTRDGCLVVDTDGDTVPDSQDVCPNEFGLVEWAGCADVDQDGLTTQFDGCPTVFGTRENNGCPITPSPTPTLQVTLQPLPQLPTSGACVLATFDYNRVNIRTEPITGNIVGQLDPFQIYNVLGRTTAADGTWYQVNTGWVGGGVTRTGGDCSTLPDTFQPLVQPTPIPDSDGDGILDPADNCPQEAGIPENNGCPASPVVLVDSTIESGNALQFCPQHQTTFQTLPIFIQLEIANGLHPNPCDYIDSLLNDVAVGTPEPLLTPEITRQILTGCPATLPSMVGMSTRLNSHNKAAWQTVNSLMTPENTCEITNSITNGMIPPQLINSLSNPSSATPLPFLQSRFAPTYNPVNTLLLDTAIAMCILSPISTERAGFIRHRMQQAGVTESDLVAFGCPLVEFFNMYGDLTPDKREAVSLLQTACSLSIYDAYYVIYLADAAGVNFTEILKQDSATLCADPLTAMSAFLKDPVADADIAPQMQSCADIAYLLKGYDSELSLYHLWVILSAATPCNKAVKFMEQGMFIFSDQEHPLPACLSLGADNLTLADGTLLDAKSAWAHQIFVLSREDICASASLPPADDDSDTLFGDVDRCPTEFSLNPDGCPDGALENIAPILEPIPSQTMLAGGFINVGVIASDEDGDALSLTAASSDFTIANVIAANNLLTITANTVGTITITVEISDGAESVTQTFPVTVNPPVANTPPAVNPIGEQTIQAGTTLEIPIEALDSDGNPLVLSASSASSKVARVALNGSMLTLTGMDAGSTTITVIASDGSTTGGAFFNVVVIPPSLRATTNDLPSGTTRLVNTALRTEAAQIGLLPPNLARFGLMELPETFTPNANAVFQAREGERTTFYAVIGDEITAPLKDTPDNAFYPALDPAGRYIAFLSTDAANAVTLQVLNVKRNEFTVVLTDEKLKQADKANFKIALYPPSWSPDGKRLLVTLINEIGDPSIHALDVSDLTNIPAPERLVENVTAGAYAPNGRYVAFEHRDKQGVQNIYVMVETPTEIKVHPITNQTTETPCFAPQFGADSLNIYFVCQIEGQAALFRYGIEGLTEISIGVANIGNPAPSEGFLGFDDGSVIYYGDESGTTITPLIQLENQNVSHVRWVTLSALDE